MHAKSIALIKIKIDEDKKDNETKAVKCVWIFFPYSRLIHIYVFDTDCCSSLCVAEDVQYAADHIMLGVCVCYIEEMPTCHSDHCMHASVCGQVFVAKP